VINSTVHTGRRVEETGRVMSVQQSALCMHSDKTPVQTLTIYKLTVSIHTATCPHNVQSYSKLNVGQLQLSSGNSAPNSGKHRHLQFQPKAVSIVSRDGACVKGQSPLLRSSPLTATAGLDCPVAVCRITYGAAVRCVTGTAICSVVCGKLVTPTVISTNPVLTQYIPRNDNDTNHHLFSYKTLLALHF
jgi:hypothetical protein